MTRDEWPRTRPELRLSDADRDRAVAELGEHYAAGRIDKDEFDERSDAVWTARTTGDLEPVFADLVAPAERRASRHAGPWWRRGWYPVPFLPVLFVLIALTAVTHVPFVLLGLVAWFLLVGRRHRRGHW